MVAGCRVEVDYVLVSCCISKKNNCVVMTVICIVFHLVVGHILLIQTLLSVRDWDACRARPHMGSSLSQNVLDDCEGMPRVTVLNRNCTEVCVPEYP